MARAVAALDLELALFPGGAGGRARDALRELVDGRVLLRPDPPTAEMLEAFGWEPHGEPGAGVAGFPVPAGAGVRPAPR